MAYDAARGVTVLFGGSDAGGYNGQTWEWNGSTWAEPSTSGPSARCSHAMTYDAARGVTVLFGGYDPSTGYNGETWELAATCSTCAGDINADTRVDGLDIAAWVRCALATPQPGDVCACTNGMTAAQFVNRLLTAANTACP